MSRFIIIGLLLLTTVYLGMLFANHRTIPSQDSTLAVVDAHTCISNNNTPAKNILALASLNINEPEAQAMILDLGVNWVRVEFRWDQIEAEQDQYDWTYHDAIVTFLNEHGINIIATINHPPVWSHTTVDTLKRGTEKFLLSFAEHYGASVEYYEIFNEPNLPGFGWPFGGENTAYDAQLYAHVLVAANNAIRAVDSEAFILLAGLSPDGTDAKEWVTELYKHIVPDCYDIFVYHPYGADNNLVAVQNNFKQFIDGIDPKNKPVWFGEFGTNEDNYRTELLEVIDRQLSQLDMLVWFSLRDLKKYGWNFGLVEYDWRKKPEYEQFKIIVKEHNESLSN